MNLIWLIISLILFLVIVKAINIKRKIPTINFIVAIYWALKI